MAVFRPLFPVDLQNGLLMGQSSHRCSLIIILLNLSGILDMGSFLTIVVKLYSYIDSDVRNLRKYEYFHDYFRPSRNA